MKASDFIPKSDIRHLIKSTRTPNKRIEHPHARYNQLGRISCVVCGVQIKSEYAWNAHILSKTHKQNESREHPVLLKRSAVDPSGSVSTDSKVSRLSTLTTSDDSAKPKVALAIRKPSENVGGSDGEENSVEKSLDSGSYSNLPEGFFDDKYKDAKVRNVPYKDKLTEEVELFQKELVALEKKSEEILEKENEAMVSRRELDEIDTQLQKWRKIQQLELEKETLEGKIKSKLNQNVNRSITGPLLRIKEEPYSSDSADSEDPEDCELYDFRAKNTV